MEEAKKKRTKRGIQSTVSVKLRTKELTGRQREENEDKERNEEKVKVTGGQKEESNLPQTEN